MLWLVRQTNIFLHDTLCKLRHLDYTVERYLFKKYAICISIPNRNISVYFVHTWNCLNFESYTRRFETRNYGKFLGTYDYTFTVLISEPRFTPRLERGGGEILLKQGGARGRG